MIDPARTYGAGDPRIPSHLESLHNEAQRSGKPLYFDPHLGLWVQTSGTLARNGKCCGRACRHCPYDRAEQKRAGRPELRPE